MILHPKQKIVASDSHRFRVVNCGRRFGKTSLSAVEMIGYAVAADQARVPYYAPTREDARDIMWGMLCKEAEEIILEKNESRLEIIVRNRFGGNSQLLLYGWEAVQERKKGVGVKNNFIVLDEVSKYRNFWEGWHEVLRPTLTDLIGHALFISTPNGFNHFYDLFNLETKDSDYKSFHFTSYDNPYLPVDELNKAKRELTEDRFSQEYMADFRKTEGLVYKEFNRSKHLFNDDEEKTVVNIVEVFAGVDFGHTNPAAVIKIVKDYDSNYWVTHEWYKTGQTDAQTAEYVAACGFNKVYPDPESAGGVQELKNRGVNVREVIKNKDSVRSGIQKVRELFLTGKLKIHARCVNLIMELETYSYPEKQDMRNEPENPIKENDHACLVAKTNILMANGKLKPIKEISIGDKVQTQKGFQKVIDWKLTKKNAEIYELRLSNGLKIRGTKEHKIYTKRGIIRLDALRYNDTIETIYSFNLSLWKKQSYLLEKDIIGMVSIMRQLAVTKMVGKDYIKQFGKKRMEKFQKDFIYTTKMVIEQITNSLILNLKELATIYQNILKTTGNKKNLEKKLEKIWNLSEILRRNGIHLNRELSGMKDTEKNRGKIEKKLIKYANFVLKNFVHISLQEQDFVIRIVERKHCGKEDVYNITVENEHNYYANGILVKNCDALRYALMMQTTAGIAPQQTKVWYPSATSLRR